MHIHKLVVLSKKNNPNLEGSQLMHLDHEDFQQIKLFFFFEDVDKDTGPLVALDQKDSTNIQKTWLQLKRTE